METFVDLQKSLINISNLDIFARHPFITTGGDHFFARISNFIVEKITLQFTFSTKRLMRSLRIC